MLCWCADVMVDDDESESLLFSVPCRGCKRGDEDNDARDDGIAADCGDDNDDNDYSRHHH